MTALQAALLTDTIVRKQVRSEARKLLRIADLTEQEIDFLIVCNNTIELLRQKRVRSRKPAYKCKKYKTTTDLLCEDEPEYRSSRQSVSMEHKSLLENSGLSSISEHCKFVGGLFNESTGALADTEEEPTCAKTTVTTTRKTTAPTPERTNESLSFKELREFFETTCNYTSANVSVQKAAAAAKKPVSKVKQIVAALEPHAPPTRSAPKEWSKYTWRWKSLGTTSTFKPNEKVAVVAPVYRRHDNTSKNCGKVKDIVRHFNDLSCIEDMPMHCEPPPPNCRSTPKRITERSIYLAPYTLPKNAASRVHTTKPKTLIFTRPVVGQLDTKAHALEQQITERSQ